MSHQMFSRDIMEREVGKKGYRVESHEVTAGVLDAVIVGEYTKARLVIQLKFNSHWAVSDGSQTIIRPGSLWGIIADLEISE